MSKAEKIELGIEIGILIVIGIFTGWASFTHVHDWTMANSTAGTNDWFGWVNAVISELVPVAALLEIRRRRRNGKPVKYPMFLMSAAVTVSLVAQLSEAKPTAMGWLVSALPALAFLGLSKMVLSGKVEAEKQSAAVVTPAPAPPPAVIPPAPQPAPAVTPARPVPVKRPSDVSEPARRATPRALTNQANVAGVFAKNPNATPAQIAALAGVSESTARRYMRREPAAAPKLINGHDPVTV